MLHHSDRSSRYASYDDRKNTWLSCICGTRRLRHSTASRFRLSSGTQRLAYTGNQKIISGSFVFPISITKLKKAAFLI
jgi:hypothetical protein